MQFSDIMIAITDSLNE